MNKVSWVMGLVAFGVVITSAIIQFARSDFMGSMMGLFSSLAAVGTGYVVYRLWRDVAKDSRSTGERVPMLVLSISGALFGLALLLGAFAHL